VSAQRYATAGGPMQWTIADFRRRVLLRIEEELTKPLPDNALIGVLCESDRLADEYTKALEGDRDAMVRTLGRMVAIEAHAGPVSVPAPSVSGSEGT